MRVLIDNHQGKKISKDYTNKKPARNNITLSWATMGNLNRRPWKLELMTRETEPAAMEIEDDGTCTNDDGKLNYRQWSRNRSGLPKIVEGMAVVFLLGHDGQNWARNNILASRQRQSDNATA